MKPALLSIAMVFLFAMSVFSQETRDTRIKLLTDNIARLEAAQVSDSMRAAHQQNINEQRIDLIALLGEKKGDIESYLSSWSANLLPEQRERTSQQIREIDATIERQKKLLKAELANVAKAGDDVGASNNRALNNPQDSERKPVGVDENDSSDATVQPFSSPSVGASRALAAAGNTSSSTCASVLLAPSSFSIREQQICALVQEVADAKLGSGLPRRVPDATLRLDGAETYIVNIIAEAKTLADVQDRRTDKQVGTDAQSAGTTSLVVKGGTPALLSWAVENGAAVATASGTTINFRFNPLGLIHALSNTGYFASYDESEKDPFTKFLRKTSFGLSFDASRGTSTVVFTGSKQQISGWSARYEFVSDRDPRNPKYSDEWAKLVDEQQIDYTTAATKLRGALVDPPHCSDPNANPCPREKLVLAQFKDPVLQKWLDETNDSLRKIQPDAATPESAVIADVEAVIRKQVGALSIDKIGATTRNQIVSFVQSLDSYLNARDTLLSKIGKGKVMAFEYTNHRKVNAPDTSNFMFIAEKGTVKNMDLTFNASMNIYNKRPAGLNISRIRDFVFAGQFDAPLREVSGVGVPVFSIAGRYERSIDNVFALDGTVIPNTKGDVGSLQLKVVLPIKGTGIRLPFSVTFANRTELIREREVRANFGFTFDFDRLFSNNPFFKH